MPRADRPSSGTLGDVFRALAPDLVSDTEARLRKTRERGFVDLEQRRPPATPATNIPRSEMKQPKLCGDLSKPPVHGSPALTMFEKVSPARHTPAPGEVKRIDPARLKGEPALRFVRGELARRSHDIADLRPETVDPALAALIDARIARGADLLRAHPDPDPDGYTVGFDFGTSSTKVVYHQPFSADDPSAALPVPHPLRSAGVEHMWQTAVWRGDAGYTLHPRSEAVMMQGFKTGLIAGAAGDDGLTLRRLQSACAYLALMVAYVVGYADEVRPLGPRGSTRAGLFHVGLPVAGRDDDRTRARWVRLLNAAFLLAASARAFDRGDVEAALALAGERESGADPFLLFCELEGVITGYRATPGHRTGAHFVVDVGASTLDVATLRIVEDGPNVRTEIYSAGVEVLGAEALSWARAAAVPDACFRHACIEAAWARCFHASRELDLAFNRTVSAEPISMLLVGGGRQAEVQKRLFEYREKDLYLGVPMSTPTPPSTLRRDPSVDFARLLVAYGLSRSPVEFPDIRLPSRATAIPSAHRDWVTYGVIDD